MVSVKQMLLNMTPWILLSQSAALAVRDGQPSVELHLEIGDGYFTTVVPANGVWQPIGKLQCNESACNPDQVFRVAWASDGIMDASCTVDFTSGTPVTLSSSTQDSLSRPGTITGIVCNSYGLL